MSLTAPWTTRSIRDQENDIWIWDFTRQTLTRLTFDAAQDNYPAWTPDGQRIAFASSRDGFENLFWKAADGTGTAEPLSESANPQVPYAFSPDGTQLVLRDISGERGNDIGLLSMDGDRQATPLLSTEFTERNAELSPDGRWIAYGSNDCGQDEIYVRPFPNVDDGRWQISTGGGRQPLWGPDGRELFYRTGAGALVAVDVQPEPNFIAGSPTVVVEQRGYVAASTGRSYDVSPDGERFLMIKTTPETDDSVPPARLVFILNWFEELQARVPTGR